MLPLIPYTKSWIHTVITDLEWIHPQSQNFQTLPSPHESFGQWVEQMQKHPNLFRMAVDEGHTHCRCFMMICFVDLFFCFLCLGFSLFLSCFCYGVFFWGALFSMNPAPPFSERSVCPGGVRWG